MFFAAIAHKTVFSYRDYKSLDKKTALMGLRDLVAPTDIIRDVRNLANANLAKISGEENYEFGQLTKKVINSAVGKFGNNVAAGGGGAMAGNSSTSEAALGSQRTVMGLLAAGSSDTRPSDIVPSPTNDSV